MGDMTGFNADDHESGSFEPLPAADYLLMGTKTEWVKTAAGTGEFLKFDFEVIDGEHKGSTVFARLNLKNPSAKAVKIANGQLADLCRAVGVLRPQDSSELCNKPFVGKVSLEPYSDRDGNQRYSNDIKAYMASSGAAPAAPAKGPVEEPAAAANSSPPWKR